MGVKCFMLGLLFGIDFQGFQGFQLPLFTHMTKVLSGVALDFGFGFDFVFSFRI